MSKDPLILFAGALGHLSNIINTLNMPITRLDNVTDWGYLPKSKPSFPKAKRAKPSKAKKRPSRRQRVSKRRNSR